MDGWMDVDDTTFLIRNKTSKKGWMKIFNSTLIFSFESIKIYIWNHHKKIFHRQQKGDKSMVNFMYLFPWEWVGGRTTTLHTEKVCRKFTIFVCRDKFMRMKIKARIILLSHTYECKIPFPFYHLLWNVL